MKRVLFLTTVASPYRIHFFDALGKQMDVTVLFSENNEAQHHRSPDWFVNGDNSFHRVMLQKLVMTVGGEQLRSDVIGWLKQSWDHIVICGYSSPTAMLAIGWLRLHRKKFWMEVD